MHQLKRGKPRIPQDDKDVDERDPDLVKELISRLESAGEVIEDLRSVLDEVDIDYDVRNLFIYIYSCSVIKHILRVSSMLQLPRLGQGEELQVDNLKWQLCQEITTIPQTQAPLEVELQEL